MANIFLPNESVNAKDGIWVQDSLAMKIGLETGDKILKIDDEKIRNFNGITLGFINGNNFTLERNGEILEKKLPVDFIAKLMDRRKNEEGPVVSTRYPFIIAKVQKDSINENSGLKPKDIVTSINGDNIKYYDEAEAILSKYKGQEITLSVKRGNETKEIPVKVTDRGTLGVVFGGVSYNDLAKLGYYDLANIEYSFAEAIPAGWNKSWKTLTDYVKQLKKIFNPSTGAYKGLGGFISIGSIFPDEFSAESFWNITAFLSIMLGFMNLLPIPALDGGHVVFTLWEMITGKKPGDKFLEYAQVTGFILLVALLLFANGNDIFRLFK
jgi:regulator of sigma E protease